MYFSGLLYAGELHVLCGAASAELSLGSEDEGGRPDLSTQGRRPCR